MIRILQGDVVDKLRELPDQSVQRVEALMQGGTTAEQQVKQLIGVIGSLLERLNTLEKRLEAR
jgi:alanine dehydrogenase